MNIESLTKRISDIESELRQISAVCAVEKSDGIVLGAIGTFLALSIFEFPRWVSFAGLIALLGKCYHIYSKLESGDKAYKNIRASILKNLLDIKDVCKEFENKALITPLLDPGDKNKVSDGLPQNINSIIEPLQRLENTALGFGEKFHGIVRDEVERVLRRFNLEFIEYSEDTKDCYDIEEADIKEVEYASVAIVKKDRDIDSRESPIILKGKVFIPHNN